MVTPTRLDLAMLYMDGAGIFAFVIVGSVLIGLFRILTLDGTSD